MLGITARQKLRFPAAVVGAVAELLRSCRGAAAELRRRIRGKQINHLFGHIGWRQGPPMAPFRRVKIQNSLDGMLSVFVPAFLTLSENAKFTPRYAELFFPASASVG